MSFQEAFVKLIQHEGHYSNLVTDKGGETAWGLSKRSYPSLDMKTLTMNEAGAIYKRDFWDKLGCDEFVSEKLAFQVFDAAVNSGIFQVTKWLQRSVNTHADGILGPDTMNAMKLYDESTILARFNGHRLAFMCELGDFAVFGRGWAKRIASNLKEA